ncbi:MAG: aldehyde dehydrogenase, partial [Candidatus Binatia bacterium]
MTSGAASLEVGSALIPEAGATMPRTSRAGMDEAVAAVRRQKDAWARLRVGERIPILEELLRSTEAAAPGWVEAALAAKRIPPGTQAEGEEWLAGPMVVLRNLRLLAATLRDVARDGRPRFPGAPRTRAGGEVVVPVFPATLYDRILFSGIRAEVWMKPEVSLERLDEHVAVAYRGGAANGGVALVLGAGNVSSIGPMDALYKLYAENRVVVLKMNPVNEYLGPIFADALAPLVRRDFLRIVYG